MGHFLIVLLALASQITAGFCSTDTIIPFPTNAPCQELLTTEHLIFKQELTFEGRFKLDLFFDQTKRHYVVIKWTDQPPSKGRRQEVIEREWRILSELNDLHVPNIPKAIDQVHITYKKLTLLHGPGPLKPNGLIMEHIPGSEFYDHVIRFIRGDQQNIFAFTRYLHHMLSELGAIAHSLTMMHEHHFIHGDIKPWNLHFNIVGKLYLLDFGSAIKHGDPLLGLHGLERTEGTDFFEAPEGIDNPTALSDMYAFGMVLTYAFSPHHSLRTISGDTLRWPEQLAEVQLAISEIAERCTREKPEDRFTSMSEVYDKLLQALSRVPLEP